MLQFSVNWSDIRRDSILHRLFNDTGLDFKLRKFIIKEILGRGANTSKMNSNGHTILAVPFYSGSMPIFNILIALDIMESK